MDRAKSSSKKVDETALDLAVEQWLELVVSIIESKKKVKLKPSNKKLLPFNHIEKHLKVGTLEKDEVKL